MLLQIFRFSLDAKSRFNEQVKKFDLTFGQWQVLKTINTCEDKKLLILEIANRINSDKATISGIIKKLESKNMVVVTPSPKDKRKKYVQLSKSMKEQCDNLKKIEEDFTNELFGNLDLKEKKQLENILKKIRS